MHQSLKFGEQQFILKNDAVILPDQSQAELPVSTSRYQLLVHDNLPICVGDYYLRFDGLTFENIASLPQHKEALALGPLLIVFSYTNVFFYNEEAQLIRQVSFKTDEIKDGYAIERIPYKLLDLTTEEVYNGSLENIQGHGLENFAGFSASNNGFRVEELLENVGLAYKKQELDKKQHDLLENIRREVKNLEQATSNIASEIPRRISILVEEEIASAQKQFDEQLNELQKLQKQEIYLMELKIKELKKSRQ